MKCHKQARRCTPIIVGLAMGVTNGVERRRAFGGGGGGSLASVGVSPYGGVLCL